VSAAVSLPQVMTRAEVAKLLRVHPATVARLVRQAGLPSHKLGVSREYRFLRDEVLQWLSSQEGE
jgi:excisionase family DNA binding protein